MSTQRLDGELLALMVKSGAATLKNNAATVNDLNVFPIPDGDTGDNMCRTVEGGTSALGNDTGTVSEISKKLSDGMLLSARGNSGVILSQFFAGLSDSLNGLEYAGLSDVANAFFSGVKQAYASVVSPTEGTILTVMREATDAANSRINEFSTLEEYFGIFMQEMYASIERTPELLPILRESGVIDSGGAGFVYIIEGMNRALLGEAVLPDSNDGTAALQSQGGSADIDSFTADSEMEFGYCTELLVQLTNSKCDPEKFSVDTLIDYLKGIGGESIVAFMTGTRVKLHVHTYTPDKVLAYCLTLGEFISVKVENMAIQHSTTKTENRFVIPEKPQKRERKPFGVVAVAQGDGIKEMFCGFGADYIVDGQQTMNPSTEDFIKAYEEINADKIIVLPNNSNIIFAAEQSAKLYNGSEIYVLKSKTVAEGYAALTMLDFSSGEIDTIMSELQTAIDEVTTGLITYAVRDCELCGKTIHLGDSLGFIDSELVSVGGCDANAAKGLLDCADMTGKQVIIMMLGRNAKSDDAEAIRGYIKQNLPSVELYEVDGGQDIYSFIFAIE